MGVLFACAEGFVHVASHELILISPYFIAIEQGLAALIWTSQENGKDVRYEQEPLVGLWRRFLSNLLGVLAPPALL